MQLLDRAAIDTFEILEHPVKSRKMRDGHPFDKAVIPTSDSL
jgi:hypothetical protein